MGASGNLCASVYVSIDENAEATGLWPQMSHPTDPWALQGPRRGHELRSLIFESFEFWNVGNVMFTVSSGINFQRISIFSGWAHLGYARIVEGGTLSGSLLSSLVLENHCFWEKNLFFQDVISCKRSTVIPFFSFFFFAFSYFSWGSQVKNTEVVCLSLLQWIMFCLTQGTWVWANSRRWWKTETWSVAIHGVARSWTQLSN